MLVFVSGLLLTAAATWPLVWMGCSLYWGDVMLYFLPALEFTRSAFADGYLPLWNPHVLCGQPFIGNPQASVLYPTSALLPFITPTRFMSVSVIVHVGMAWAGVYRCARTLEVSRSGALLAAATFVGGGAFLLRLQFPTMFQAMAWMPWILHCSVRLANRVSLRRVAAMGVVSASSILSAHPQITYMSLLLAIAAMVWSLLGVGWRTRGVRLLSWVGATAIGGVAASAYWLPAVDVLRLSVRPELALGKADRFTVAWQHVIGMLWPGYVGSPVSGNYWAPGNVWEPALFIGVPQLAFVVAGAAQWRRSAAARFHGWLALLSFWLALGVSGGLYALAYLVVPGMSVFHDPARFGIPCTLGLACLAGIGADRMRCRLRGWHYAVVGASIAGLLTITTSMTPTVRAKELEYRPRLLALASGRRLYSAERQDTWERYVNYADYGAESGRYVHELTDTVTPNIGMRYGLHDAGGYEPVPLRTATMIEGLLRQATQDQAPVLGALASLMDVGYVLMPVGLSIQHPDLMELDGRESVFRLTSGSRSPVRLFGHTRVIPDLRRTLEVLGVSQFPHATVAVVNRPAGLPDGLSATPELCRYDRITWKPVREGGDCVLSGMNRQGLAAFSIPAMPGWTATLDNRHADIVRVNGAFLGVVVPAGEHTVRLRYRPAAFRIGLFGTLMGVMVLAAIGTAGAIAMRRPAGTLAQSRTP